MMLPFPVTVPVPPVGPLRMVTVSESPSGSRSLLRTSITKVVVSDALMVSFSAMGELFNELLITVMNTVSVSQSTGDPLSQIL